MDCRGTNRVSNVDVAVPGHGCYDGGGYLGEVGSDGDQSDPNHERGILVPELDAVRCRTATRLETIATGNPVASTMSHMIDWNNM